MRIEGEEEMEAERRRCLAVAVRAGRGGGGREVGGLRIGWRKAGVGDGRESEVREEVNWASVGALFIVGFAIDILRGVAMKACSRACEVVFVDVKM